MVIEIIERVLTYRPEQLAAWCSGDKSLTPEFAGIPAIVRNQPRYHFAETLTLRHYHESGGWIGFAHYALGPQFPRSQRRARGRMVAEEIIPRESLEHLRELRSDPAIASSGRGEPDLFLYKGPGIFRFVEVKKDGDRLRDAQRVCIAQIIAVLGCGVDVVRVHEAGRMYVPKTHKLELGGTTDSGAA